MSTFPDAASWVEQTFGLTAEDPAIGPEVPASRLVEVAKALKQELGFHYLCYCVAAHYEAVPGQEPPLQEAEKVIEEPPPPVDPGKPDRVLVTYRVRRLGRDTTTFAFHHWVAAGETCPTLTGVWAGADWQEREQYDLVGVVFEGHPDLRRIMLPEDWVGHPLRRDYAIDTRHHPWR